MNAIQMDLFGDTATQSAAQSNVLVDSHLRHSKAGQGTVQVRSHLRRVKGNPATSAELDRKSIEHHERERLQSAGNSVNRHLPINPNITAPHNSSHTSREAALSLSSEHLQAQEALVLRVVRESGKHGLIREEIATLTGLEITDVCRVCNGLVGTSEAARKARRPSLLSDGPDTRRSSRGRGQKVVRAVAAVSAVGEVSV
jgi:hypothetical protein